MTSGAGPGRSLPHISRGHGGEDEGQDEGGLSRGRALEAGSAGERRVRGACAVCASRMAALQPAVKRFKHLMNPNDPDTQPQLLVQPDQIIL